VLRYVVLNPVRANMIRHPEGYEWSSHRAVLGQVPAPSWLAVDDALIGFAPDRDLARANYRTFVNEGIRSEKRLWDDLVGQQYLGRPEWIDLMRGRIALKPRSAEIPRAQLLLNRISMAAVIAAVAKTFLVSEDQIRNRRGRDPRLVAAWIAWNDGRLKGREIAAGLGLRSPGAISEMVRAAKSRLALEPRLQKAVDRCRSTLGGKG
jgi:hypothetical protein